MRHLSDTLIYEANWFTDKFGNRTSREIEGEQQFIADGKAYLNCIPDQYYKLKITGMHEISILSTITHPLQFKVDYSINVVYFHSNLNGSIITIDRYYGRGVLEMSYQRLGIGFKGSNAIMKSTANQEIVPFKPNSSERYSFYKFEFNNLTPCTVKINGDNDNLIYLPGGKGFTTSQPDREISSFIIIEANVQYSWNGRY